jgi:hypothetical protein
MVVGASEDGREEHMPLLALLVTLGAAVFQTAQAPPTKYDGTWIGQFEGITWVVLELRTANGAVTGRIGTGNIEMNMDGALKHVEPAPKDLSPIFDVRQRGAVIVFSRKEGDDTEQFEIEVKGTEAELRFVLTDEIRREFADEGIPIPKPFRLTRK